MRRILKFLGRIIGVLALAGVGLYFFGPREPIDATVTFDASVMGDDLDAYLAKTESAFDDITPGANKRIIWAGAVGAKTEVSVVYMHGFSATSEEIRPVPDKVAEALGANLYFSRLHGHGRGSLAMAEPSMNDWVQDTAEAMAIGRRLGERVIVISTSTGGTLSVLAASHPDLRDGLAGLAMVAPNFGPKEKLSKLANWPLARSWVPLVAGEWIEWTPSNDLQAKFWTHKYKMVSVMPLMAAVKYVAGVDKSQIKTPAVFIYSRDDDVVDYKLTEAAIEAWGGPKDVDVRKLPNSAPTHHVIAGDIMNPSENDATIERILDWARGL